MKVSLTKPERVFLFTFVASQEGNPDTLIKIASLKKALRPEELAEIKKEELELLAEVDFDPPSFKYLLDRINATNTFKGEAAEFILGTLAKLEEAKKEKKD